MVKFIKYFVPLLPAVYAQSTFSDTYITHSKFNGWAKEGNVDAMRDHLNELASSSGASEFVSEGDHWSKSAMHYAAEHGHADVISLLRGYLSISRTVGIFCLLRILFEILEKISKMLIST